MKNPVNGSTKRPFSRPILYITSVNIEGLSSNKELLLENMCIYNKCDILVVQETHRSDTMPRPKIKNMNLIMERCHEKYGSAIFINPDLKVFSTAITDINDIEILTVELEACTVTSVYKPPNIDFQFNEPVNFRNKKHQIVMGDFNSRSVTWGYSNTDKNGEALEDWAELNGLKIIHDSKLPCSFQSGRWRRGTNPDNIFVSNSLASQSVKLVEDPIPRTQHRAITCQITTIIKVESQPFARKFNFKKARWTEFSEELDTKIIDLPPTAESYEAFKDLVQKISRKHIPRGCRTKYITGLDEHSKLSLEKYQELYENDPFSDETILAGEELVQSLSDSRSKK